MKAKAPMIMLEFNELSPSLMDQFIAAGHLPNFQRLRDQSRVFVTEADEVAPNLEPWIQWITIHTGLSYKQHGIFDLGDGHKLAEPRVYETLSETGHKVWICGSMNTAFRRPPNGFFLPDPWSTGVSPYPRGIFEDFFDYVRRNVQEHSRNELSASRADHARFLGFMLRHGLSLDTIQAIVRQLWLDRGGRFRWKRAVILDRLQWDVFAHVWKRERPDFATFFINSTAHFQHMYWRNMEPDQFRITPSEAEQAEYKDAVLFGYQSMDHLVGRCLEMAGSDTTVVLATALGQQPCLTYEGTAGKTFYRAIEPKEFFAFAGLHSGYRYAPVMSEQFHLYCQDEETARQAESLLAALRCGGEPLMMVRREGVEIFGGCSIFHAVDRQVPVTSASGASLPFGKLLYQAAGIKSGMHHPDGIFWVRDPRRTPSGSERIPLQRVAPTLLAYFGLPRQAFMQMEALPGYENRPMASSETKPVPTVV